MYAVIETGGKQYRVSEGDVITVEKLKVEDGGVVEFDKVLVIGEGADLAVGTPYLDAAKVFGSVVESGKSKKVIIFKYKSKKDYRKKQGHRQPYTMIQIDGISAEGKAPAKKETPKKAEAAHAAEEAPATEGKAEKPAAEKKPVAKKAAEAGAEKKSAAKKPAAEKKPVAKKTTEDDAAEEKKPAKKAPAKKSELKEKTEE